MSYIDRLKNKYKSDTTFASNFIGDAIADNDYNSSLLFHSASIVPHPQKRNANCLQISLFDSESNQITNSLSILIDEYEVIRTQKLINTIDYNPKDKTSLNKKLETIIYHPNEQTFLEDDRLFQFVLKNYHKMMYKEFGMEYIDDAISHRRKNIDSYKSALKTAKDYQSQTCASMSVDELTLAKPETNKKARKLLEINKTIESLETTIATQIGIISHLKSISEKDNSSAQNKE